MLIQSRKVKITKSLSDELMIDGIYYMCIDHPDLFRDILGFQFDMKSILFLCGTDVLSLLALLISSSLVHSRTDLRQRRHPPWNIVMLATSRSASSSLWHPVWPQELNGIPSPVHQTEILIFVLFQSTMYYCIVLLGSRLKSAELLAGSEDASVLDNSYMQSKFSTVGG